MKFDNGTEFNLGDDGFAGAFMDVHGMISSNARDINRHKEDFNKNPLDEPAFSTTFNVNGKDVPVDVYDLGTEITPLSAYYGSVGPGRDATVSEGIVSIMVFDFPENPEIGSQIQIDSANSLVTYGEGRNSETASKLMDYMRNEVWNDASLNEFMGIALEDGGYWRFVEATKEDVSGAFVDLLTNDNYGVVDFQTNNASILASVNAANSYDAPWKKDFVGTLDEPVIKQVRESVLDAVRGSLPLREQRNELLDALSQLDFLSDEKKESVCSAFNLSEDVMDMNVKYSSCYDVDRVMSHTPEGQVTCDNHLRETFNVNAPDYSLIADGEKIDREIKDLSVRNFDEYLPN